MFELMDSRVRECCRPTAIATVASLLAASVLFLCGGPRGPARTRVNRDTTQRLDAIAHHETAAPAIVRELRTDVGTGVDISRGTNESATPSALLEQANTAGREAGPDLGTGRQPIAPLGTAPERRAVEQLWRAQQRNSEWTAVMLEYTTTAMADARIDVNRLHAVECRETMCKLDFQLSDVAEAVRLNELRDPDMEMKVFRDSTLGAYAVFLSNAEVGAAR